MTLKINLYNCSVFIVISVCVVFVLSLVVARIVVINGNPRRVVCAPNIIKFKNVGRIFLLLRKNKTDLIKKKDKAEVQFTSFKHTLKSD
jgi:hypothetical protein